MRGCRHSESGELEAVGDGGGAFTTLLWHAGDILSAPREPGEELQARRDGQRGRKPKEDDGSLRRDDGRRALDAGR